MTASESLLWLFGDAFARRLAFEQTDNRVLWSRLIPLLQTNEKAICEWGKWILCYRSLLKDPDAGPAKVRGDLKITEYDFTSEVFDVFAEVCAAVRLGQKGATEFEPIPTGTRKTPDFMCLFGGQRAAVEVKNLRVHRYPEKIMMDHYFDIALKRGVPHPLTLVLHKSTRATLGRDRHSEADMRAIVERLMDYAPNIDHEITLSRGQVVRFRLEEGGDTRAVEAITFGGDDEIITRVMRDKIRDKAKDGLTQLYAEGLGAVERRVLAMRWELPHYDMLRPAELPEVLRGDLDQLMSESGRHAEVLIFTDQSVELDTISG